MYVLVLGLIQRALGLQDREQYLGPGFIAVFGNIECLLCLFQFFVLPVPLLVQTTGAVEGFFDVGKSVDDAPPIGLQQLLLVRRGFVAFGAEAAVIEDRRCQPGGEAVERAAQDIAETV